MKRQIITLVKVLLFTLLLPLGPKVYAQVEACISIGSSHPYPIIKKTVWMCKNTTINLSGSNCKGNTSAAEEEYTWVNLSNPDITSKAQNFFTPDTGKWELTIENLTDYSIDKDTIQVKFFNTPNFAINGTAPVAGACLYQDIKFTVNTPTSTSNYQWFVENNNTALSSASSLIVKSKDIPNGSAYYIATAKYVGTYVNGSFNCILSDTILGFSKATPSAQLPNDTVVCSGQSISLEPEITILPDNTPANISGINYEWQKIVNSDTTKTSGSGKDGLNVLNTNNITEPTKIIVKTTNILGCFAKDSITIGIKTSLTVDVGPSLSSCAGGTVQLDAKVTAGKGSIQYSWTPTTNLDNPGIKSPNATILSATSYTVHVKDAAGCTGTATQTINISPGLTVDAGQPLSVCSGSIIQLDATVAAGKEPFQYSWSPATTLDNANTKSPNATITNPTTFTVSVKDAAGCSGSATKTINITPGLTININNDTTICAGALVKLDAKVAGASPIATYTYNWTPTASLKDASTGTPTANPVTTTTYNVTISDANGCKGSASTNVTVKPGISITNFTDSTTAGTDIVKLNPSISGGDGNYIYSWTPASSIDVSTNVSMNVNPDKITTYTLKVKDGISCSAEISILIDKLWVDLGGEDTTGIIGDSVKLNAFNDTQLGFSYKWLDSTGSIIGTNKILYVKTPGIYKVYVFNPITSSFVVDSQRVKFIREIKPIVEIPNVLSPSMENENDKTLRVYGQNISDNNFLFQVYNNWGELVYEANSFKEANERGWNGSFKNSGKELNLGVYTYTVKGEFKDGSSFSKSGTASLIK